PVLQDLGQQCRHLGHVLAQPRLRAGGDDAAQVGAGGEVVDGLQVDLLAYVDAQLLLRVVHVLQRLGERLDVLPGLVLDEAEEHGFLVREVVVHRGAAHTGARGDVGHAHRVETGLGHQLRERGEQLGADTLTVLGEGRADDLGHRPIIPFHDGRVESVVKSASRLPISTHWFHDTKDRYRALSVFLGYSGSRVQAYALGRV